MSMSKYIYIIHMSLINVINCVNYIIIYVFLLIFFYLFILFLLNHIYLQNKYLIFLFKEFLLTYNENYVFKF
jgi:hypothetical protein